jgi:hypothetical protein
MTVSSLTKSLEDHAVTSYCGAAFAFFGSERSEEFEGMRSISSKEESAAAKQ